PAVLVRTPDAPRLAEALRTAGLTAQAGDAPGTLRVLTADPARVGDVALAAGQPVHELRPLRTDLERLFLELTEAPEHSNRNRQTAPPPAGTPHELSGPATSEEAPR